jgi:hypothetical protein
MNKVKKIGCLDPEALNYNNKAEIACERCCNNAERDKLDTEFLDFKTKRKTESNMSIDYSIYSSGYLDGQPLFRLAGQAESYSLQIGCKGYHTHLLGVKNELFYMPCETHEQTLMTKRNGEEGLVKRIISPVEDFITCDDYIDKVEDNLIIWKNATTHKIQQSCCLDKKKEGYSWDDVGRTCVIKHKEINKKVYNHSMIGTLEGSPIWHTRGAALEYSNILGCKGYHTQHLYGLEGYMACKDKQISKELSTGIDCNNAETTMDKTLIFPKIIKTGKMEYLEACCSQWIQYGFFWDSSGCKQLETPLTWSCIDGTMTEIYDGNGEYKSFKEGQKQCGISLQGNVMYNCSFGKCVATKNEDGEFRTLQECNESCSSNNTNMGKKSITQDEFINNIIKNRTL